MEYVVEALDIFLYFSNMDNCDKYILSANLEYTTMKMKIGDEISVRFGPLDAFRHVGVCYGFDAMEEPLIAHNSGRFGKVKISPLKEFSEGKAIRVTPGRSIFGPEQLQARIDERLGKPYSLTSSNCEHFKSEVWGQKRESPQLQFWGTVAVFACVILAAKSNKPVST